MSEKNPIELELDKLDAQWEDFVSTDKPIFRWLLKTDDQQLANTYIRVKEQFGDDTSDMFIGLHGEFTHAGDYGFQLATEMNTLLEEGFRAAIEDEARDGEEAVNPFTWNQVDLSGYGNGFQAFLDNCQRVLDSFGRYIDCLTVVVMPSQINRLSEWQQWWATASELHRDFRLWPDKLRLVVFELVNSPLLHTQEAAFPEQWHSVVSATHMRGALNEVLRKADDGSPGATLRQLITDMNYAVGEQDLAALTQTSEQALVLATEHQFLDMVTTVLMIRAAGFLNAGEFKTAVVDYRQAQISAREGIAKATPGCDQLLLQSIICEGTALFSDGQYQLASKTYEAAAELAEQQQNTLMTLEGWRMASFCLERDRQTTPAWERGIKALEAGRKMKPEEMQASTLPFVGDALLRIAPDANQEKQVKQTFDDLLGSDWQDKLREATAQC